MLAVVATLERCLTRRRRRAWVASLPGGHRLWLFPAGDDFRLCVAPPSLDGGNHGMRRALREVELQIADMARDAADRDRD